MTNTVTNTMPKDVATESKKQINLKIISSHVESLKDTIHSLEYENTMLSRSLELYKQLYYSLAKNNNSDNINDEKDEN